MEKNYLKRKKRKQKIIRSTIFLIIALILINYVWLYLAGFYKACPALILVNIVVAWIYLSSLGIKFFKKSNPGWLDEELSLLDKKYREIYNSIQKKEEESAKLNNNRCPICLEKSVISKQRRVSGNINGSFSLGFGSVAGEIDTSPVNMCSKCGNEWKKYEASISEIMSNTVSQILSPIYNFFVKGENNNSDDLKKYRARSVKAFIKRYNYHPKAKELDELTVKDLRKYGCK